MDIWLDDLRPPPEGWEWVTTPEEVIDALSTGQVKALSLDNDLGIDIPEGNTVVQWMKDYGHWPELLCVHSSNTVAVSYMKMLIDISGLYERPQPIKFTVDLPEHFSMPEHVDYPPQAEIWTPGTTVQYSALMWKKRVLTGQA